MRFCARSMVGLAAVVVLNLAIHDSLGYFTPLSFAGVVLAFLLALAACLMRERTWGAGTEVDGNLLVLTCTALAMTTLGVSSIHLTFSARPGAITAIYLLSLSGFAVCLGSLLRPPIRTLMAPVTRAGWAHHRRGIVTGFLLGLAVIAARILLDLAYVSLATLGAFVGLYAVGAFLYLRRRSVFRPESASEGPTVAPWLAAALLLGMALRGSVIVASPNPVIDVYAMMRDGTDHLLAGRNPYTEEIDTPYDVPESLATEGFEPPDPRPAGYPPHPFLITAPFRLFRLDPRWADVVCDVIAAAAVYGVGLRRGRPRAGFLAAAMFLFLPRTTVMIESCWYEPMLAALFGVGFWLAEAPGWRRWLGYAVLGLALTAKQYGIALLPALAWPHRRNWRPMLVGLVVGGLVMLPWILWSPAEFMDTILWKHLARPSQHERAMTIAAACVRATHWLPPRELLWAAAAGVIIVISWRAPRNGAATALGVGAALLTFSLFHTQGFFNYFHLVEYLWLLACVGLLPPSPAAFKESPP